MEPISRYAIVMANEEDDITWNCETDNMTLSGFNKNAVNIGHLNFNALAITVNRATTPEFPVRIKVTSKTKLKFIGVMKAQNENRYVMIPYDFVTDF